MTKYFIDSQGNYIGGFDGQGALDTVPDGAIEILDPPPEHNSQKWDGTKWSSHTAEVPLPTITALIKALDRRDGGDSRDWDDIVTKENARAVQI